jgi:hypothetical protein
MVKLLPLCCDHSRLGGSTVDVLIGLGIVGGIWAVYGMLTHGARTGATGIPNSSRSNSGRNSSSHVSQKRPNRRVQRRHVIYKRAKGENQSDYNARAHRLHVEEFIARKKAEGRWLPKEEFERRTGRPGRRD